jgi:hypothetical protein
MGAGDWIKMRNNLWDDPRVAQMCVLMSQPEAVIVGCLYRLWALADEHTEAGTIPKLSPAGLDRKVGYDGFSTALTAVGWLRETEVGLVIERFDEHNGQTAKRRASEAKRKASDRGDESSPQSVRSGADELRTDSGPRNRMRRTRSNTGSGSGQASANGSERRRGRSSVFETIDPDVLADLGQLHAWFVEQSQTSSRVLPNTEASWLLVVAAAEQASEGDNPAAWFASILGRRKHDQITESAKSRARQRIAEHKRAARVGTDA